ncbi:phosphate-starvation-inducible PsiE family protein [Methanocalculus taiwanensis]|nr:phosphate-starvation-inducible PsiE family protein [Methanocalculus taiwanensis]
MGQNDHLSPMMKNVMEIITRCTLVIYALIAILLIVIAFLTFFDAVYLIIGLFSHPHLVSGILEVLHVLLLTIIVVEVLETVTGYFRTNRILVRPILIAGLTAMVRKVLILSVDDIQIAEVIWIIGIIAVLTAAIYVVGKSENYPNQGEIR